ncbi:hypothetical protein TM239_45010 [Bradyrhizobium sp. TM239]|nr:hypothetical protein TM239_45010 [Bradyrhizobium sp. TM239]
MAVLGQEVELVEQGVPVEDPADAPHHALGDHTVADAEPVPIFQRPLREADRAGALADAVGVIQKDDALTALGKIDRERQPDRAGADNHDRMLGRILTGTILIGVTAIAELGFGLKWLDLKWLGLRHTRTSAMVRRALIC